MGKKGDKSVGQAEAAAESLTPRLEAVGGVTSKKMFGGVGVFSDGVMFGILDSKGGFFLRGGPGNLETFEEAGSARHGKMPYYSVPDAVLEDDRLLVEWAREAARVAKQAKK